MKIAFFSAHKFEIDIFKQYSSEHQHEISYFDHSLDVKTANLVNGHLCICAFVGDNLSAETLGVLQSRGVKLIALRSAGFNHVDLSVAKNLGIKVVRVPEYSPYAVAEHTVSLILSLNRKTHRAFNRVREGNFSLDGLMGFDLFGKTVGIIGTGKIGTVLAKIMLGFGCHVYATDPTLNDDLLKLGVEYVSLEVLKKSADIISLHLPLTSQTHHLVNDKFLAETKENLMIINTGRGGLIDTKALIKNLKNGHIGYAGLDVYEEEEGVFFENLSGKILQDDDLARLMTFPNVLITSHQGFFTKEALSNIAEVTLQNISDFENGKRLENEV